MYSTLWEKRNWRQLLAHADLFPELVDSDEDFLLMLCGAALQVDDTCSFEKYSTQALSVFGKKRLVQFLIALNEVLLAKSNYLAGRHHKALLLFHSAYARFGELVGPLLYDFLFDQARLQLASKKTRMAIQSFQDIATIFQEKTPEEVYKYMSHGYTVNAQGFGGSPEENKVWGDCHKHELLSFFHQQLQPEFYFEIGVDEGRSLARAQCKALGVDARPTLNLAVQLPETAQIVGISSDAFYQQLASSYLTQSPELAFIDGMHLFEFALRDFINLERYAAPYTLVGIDDVFPCHPIQAQRRRISDAWTGDVWKLIPILQKYRPDLTFLLLPCSTTGLLLITGLDSHNTQLVDNYDDILAEYQQDLSVPKSILDRNLSVPSDHPVIFLLLGFLRQAKENNWKLQKLNQQLEALHPFIQQAQNKASDYLPKSLKQLERDKQLELIYNTTAQLFIPQSERPVYTEKNSIKKKFYLKGWQELLFIFDLHVESKALRFDPAMHVGLFEIEEIEIVDIASKTVVKLLKGEELFSQIKLSGDGFLLKNTHNFCFYCYASNPILFLPPLEGVHGSISLRVRMRKVLDSVDLRRLWSLHLDQ